MKIQFTTLVAILCFQFSAFSMYDCDCTWELDLVCIQVEDGNIIPFPNACWAECMGYEESDFIDCNYDINIDPTCSCSFDVDPVCVSDSSGEVVLYPNACWAECEGYTNDDYLDCNYNLPIDPSCGCDFGLDEVCVEVEEGLFMPFPNSCWAECMGYEESQFVNCDDITPEELIETAQYYYDLILEGDTTNFIGETETYEFSQESSSSDQVAKFKQFELFPNPVSNQLYLKLQLEDYANVRIDFTSITGKLYKSLNHDGQKGYQILNVAVNDLPKGIYFANIYSGKESKSLKFLIQ